MNRPNVDKLRTDSMNDGKIIVGSDIRALSGWIFYLEDRLKTLDSPELLEKLSDLEHERWSGWMKYMFRVWAPEKVEMWKRKMNTSYKDLKEDDQRSEKESDRVEARRSLKIIKEWFLNNL